MTGEKAGLRVLRSKDDGTYVIVDAVFYDFTGAVGYCHLLRTSDSSTATHIDEGSALDRTLMPNFKVGTEGKNHFEPVYPLPFAPHA